LVAVMLRQLKMMMKTLLTTSFKVTDPKGVTQRIDVAVSRPRRSADSKWEIKVECPAIPCATATFVRDDPLTCVCFTLSLLCRFMRNEFRKGYKADGWGRIDDFLDALFAYGFPETKPTKRRTVWRAARRP
jgi:hypothetical protein